MNGKVPILKIAKYDRIWLKELYERSMEGNSFGIKDIWGQLNEKLPKDYRPQLMDARLVDSTGEKITIMGVIALQKNTTIFRKINKAINAVREVILKDTKMADIPLNAIATELNFSLAELSFYFQLSSHYAQFFNGSSYEHQSSRMTTIRVDGNMDIFYTYREFPGIEAIVLRKNQTESYKEEYFNYEERFFLNQKIDNIQKDLKALKLGHEVIWTDFNAEMDELKDLNFLSKKNWRQLFFGKIRDMILSGVISETISKKIIEIFTVQIKKLLLS